MAANKPKVLVIDDEHVIADTLATILGMNGFETTALYSGEEAMEWVETFRPNIVLSDIRMKQVSGLDTAIHIRRRHPECRVILFSASTITESVRLKIENLGFDLLQRPLHPRDVLTHLQSLDLSLQPSTSVELEAKSDGPSGV